MIKDEMVEITHLEKIEVYFKNLIKKRKPILLWQGPVEIKRYKVQVMLKRVDLSKGEIIFIPYKGIFKFDSRLPIYFYSKLRTAIFKKMIFFNGHYKIVVQMPELILLKNLRGDQRKIIEEQSVEIFMKDSNYSVNPRFKSILLDICKGGISFRSSYSNVIKFKVGDRLKYKTSDLDEFKEGQVVSVLEISKNKERYFRISVKNL